MKYTVDIIGKTVAKQMIENYDYMPSVSSMKYTFGLFHNDKIVGIIGYGGVTGRQTPQSIMIGMTYSEVLELKRFWVADKVKLKEKNDFLNETFDWLRKHTTAKVLITYAEKDELRYKNVLKKSNWLYQGCNIRVGKSFYYKVFGKVYYPRNANAVFGTTNKYVLKAIDPNFKMFELPKKDRFIFILNQEDKSRILSKLKHPVIA